MKADPVRDSAVDLVHALREASTVIERLDTGRIFGARINTVLSLHDVSDLRSLSADDLSDLQRCLQ